MTNAVYVIYKAVMYILLAYEFVLFLRAILSWFPTQGFLAKVYDITYRLTEPLLRPIRELLLRANFFRSLPIDFSPIVLFILIGVARRLINMLFLILI